MGECLRACISTSHNASVTSLLLESGRVPLECSRVPPSQQGNSVGRTVQANIMIGLGGHATTLTFDFVLRSQEDIYWL